jgi:tetratricopeptide (TPR) repeat protein
MQVKVDGRGLTVRGRSWVVVPKSGASPAHGGVDPVGAVTRGAATPVTAPPPRPLATSVRGLADPFARRDYAAFEAALSKTDDLVNVIRDLRTSDAAWPDAPRRSAVFALELALAGLSSDSGFTRDEAVKLLAQTHAEIRQTTGPADEFECTWYWTEAAALEGLQLPDLGLLVVPRARQRCPTHARLSLAQAVMTEQVWRRDKDSHQQQEVIARYEDARRFTETADEARLREAWFHYTTGAADRALEVLGVEPSTSPDRQVRYLHTLIKGHLLQARGEFAAAASAYRQALTIWPGAQSARIGLMTVSLQLGHGDEAAGLAEGIESAEASQLDPWWMYWRGDFRAFGDIDAALRERGQ